MKDLVAQTVQSDPQLRVQERRAKFYSSLQKATKVFEELTFDDAEVDDIYEDDMLLRLEELQQSIAACISSLQAATAGSAAGAATVTAAADAVAVFDDMPAFDATPDTAQDAGFDDRGPRLPRTSR